MSVVETSAVPVDATDTVQCPQYSLDPEWRPQRWHSYHGWGSAVVADGGKDALEAPSVPSSPLPVSISAGTQTNISSFKLVLLVPPQSVAPASGLTAPIPLVVKDVDRPPVKAVPKYFVAKNPPPKEFPMLPSHVPRFSPLLFRQPAVLKWKRWLTSH